MGRSFDATIHATPMLLHTELSSARTCLGTTGIPLDSFRRRLETGYSSSSLEESRRDADSETTDGKTLEEMRTRPSTHHAPHEHTDIPATRQIDRGRNMSADDAPASKPSGAVDVEGGGGPPGCGPASSPTLTVVSCAGPRSASSSLGAPSTTTGTSGGRLAFFFFPDGTGVPESLSSSRARFFVCFGRVAAVLRSARSSAGCI
ncbi:hypothetical protein BD310DRAFT_941805 [Dichomitus squalens]|uniref:Uncharacterized protein n=1 Tax=Dichomitus squalens TaxID=114155 RepID=A0A4Q9PGM4_9APHY|nr:hypothetical protein BD310DRAFT_941805 [Dichomitus squalens]